MVLTDPATGKHPPNTLKGQDEAWMLGIAKFVELKGKSDRGESISRPALSEIYARCFYGKRKLGFLMFLIVELLNEDIILIKSQIKWARDFMNNDKIMVHKIRRTKFDSYEIWRREKAQEYGKTKPHPQTIVSELSTISRMFKEVAVRRGFLTLIHNARDQLEETIKEKDV